ncbi:MAG: aminoacyl-tRNA hydrolase [Gammaproteobacteria bacterium]|jgi:aminoacyl-tRNA hydrolase|nr:aminoacyl-tRNA hydrolase [Gammaproteobacteria bacterium]
MPSIERTPASRSWSAKLHHGVRWRVAKGYDLLRTRAARLNRARLRDTRFIGITGSAAKTTTKDLIHLILSESHAVISSQDSRNIPVAVERTILQARARHEFCVVEAGVRWPGEADRSIRLLRPDIGVLTMIRRDHSRAFGGVDGIAAEKAKMIEALPPDGIAVLNIDDPRVQEIGARCRCRILWVGRDAGADVRLLDARSRWPDIPLEVEIEFEGKHHVVRTGLWGTQLASAVATALAVAAACGIPLERAIPPLVRASTSEGRMQIVSHDDGVTYIRDDFKAPHWAMMEPIAFLGDSIARRKIAIIGTISDYSSDSKPRYRQIAREARANADLVVFIGPNAHWAESARRDDSDDSIRAFFDPRSAAAFLRETLRPGDLVLLKGSNKADHLSRLVYDRETPIACWRNDCRVNMNCGTCRWLREAPPPDPRAIVAPIPDWVAAQRFPRPVVVGLGNPGERFLDTPHNAGYRLVDMVAERHGGEWKDVGAGTVCTIEIEGRGVTLFKPAALMNNSGPAVKRWLDAIGADAGDCVVVYDEFDLPLGDTRRKSKGGGSGHRGVRSVIQALGTMEFPRIRIGVRPEGYTGSAGARVLASLAPEDERLLSQGLNEGVGVLAAMLEPLDSGDRAGVS